MTAVGMCGSLDFHFAFTTTADLELPAVPRGVPGLVTPGAEAEPVLGAVVAADVAGARLLGRGAPVPAWRRHLHVVLAAVEVHAVSPAPEKGSCCCSIRHYSTFFGATVLREVLYICPYSSLLVAATKKRGIMAIC